jgi:hypothetical protein
MNTWVNIKREEKKKKCHQALKERRRKKNSFSLFWLHTCIWEMILKDTEWVRERETESRK